MLKFCDFFLYNLLYHTAPLCELAINLNIIKLLQHADSSLSVFERSKDLDRPGCSCICQQFYKHFILMIRSGFVCVKSL